MNLNSHDLRTAGGWWMRVTILRKIMSAHFVFSLCFATMVLVSPGFGFCDFLRLKQVPAGQEGNEVEILEERQDAFIIKVPKEQIQVIKREHPTDMNLWQEKKILWEDQGDYLTIFLPKERIVVAPGEKTSSEGTYFGKGKEGVLAEGMVAVGGEGMDKGPVELLAFGSGKVMGRVLNAGAPVAGCKVKLVYVQGQADIFNKFFGGESDFKAEGEEYVFETQTDDRGVYEFSSVPVGDYDIFWMPPNSAGWIRKLTEKPEVVVKSRKVFTYDDFDLSGVAKD